MESQPQPQPEPQPEPKPAPEYNAGHTLGRAYAPPPRFDGEETPPEGEKEKDHRGGGRRFQNILAVVILGAAVIGGGFLFMTNRSGGNPASTPPDSVQSSNQDNAQGVISISVDGQLYGTYSTYQNAIVLNTFLKAGDNVTVSCVSLPQSSAGVTVRIGTNIRVYESDRLQAGQQQTWSVRKLGPGVDPGHTASQGAVNWFTQQAEQGNPVAEYGMGNMSSAGLDGVTHDYHQSAQWFQRAAAQNYGNAAERATHAEQLEQQPQQPPPSP